jgi:hypothetical protein
MAQNILYFILSMLCGVRIYIIIIIIINKQRFRSFLIYLN